MTNLKQYSKTKLIEENHKLRQEIKTLQNNKENFLSNKNLLQNIFDTIPDPIVLKDRNSKYIYINKALCKFLGKTEDQIIGKTDYDLYSKEEAKKYIAGDQAVMAGGKQQKEEWKVKGKTEAKWLKVSKSPLKDDNDNILGIIVSVADISKIKQIDISLQQSNEKYEELLNNINSGVAVYNAIENGKDFLFVDYNKTACRIDKVKKEEIIGKSVLEIFPNVKKLGILNIFQKVWKTGIPELSKVIFYEDSRTSGWRINYVYKLSTGEIVSVFDDITRQKEDELAIIQSQNLLQNIFSTTPNPLVLIGLDGIFLFINKAFCNFIELDEKQIIGKKDTDIFTNIEIDENLFQYKGKIEYKVNQNNPQVRIGKFGIRWIKTIITPVKMKNYKFTGFLISITDISDIKNAENALIENEKKYRTFVENLQGIAFRVTANSKPIFFHGAVEKITGYTEKDFLNNSPAWNQIIHPDDYKKVMTTILKTRRTLNSSISAEYRIVTKNGTIKWLFMSIQNCRDNSNNFLYLQGLLLNITPRKQIEEDKKSLERQLRHAQKLESVGTMVSGIAHDFNNILTPIIGYSEMAKREKNPTNLSFFLNEINKAGNRAKNLIEQLNLFSSSDEKELEPIKIQIILKEVMNLIRQTIPSNIKIEIDLDQNCNEVLADETQIHQVIMNLCTNAYQAMEQKGGILKISLSQITIDDEIRKKNSELCESEYVLLQVADTGYGINSTILEMIFDPFFTTKSTGKNSGLGLSVVHGIVKNFKGVIIVDTELKKGTTFQIYLPVSKEKSRKKTPEVQLNKNTHGNERILIVDDNNPVLEMLIQMLQIMGYNCTGFLSSIKALEEFQLHPYKYDLVITDFVMEEMSGLELAENLKILRNDLPIILLTGYRNITNSIKIDINKNFDTIIMKPAIPNEIGRIIRKTLDQFHKNNHNE